MSKVSSDYTNLLRKKTFAEFFAGIGLVRMGLERLGWSAAFSNDIDPSKYQMYKGHFTDADNIFVLNDIFKLDASDIPSITLATASFPCKDLSLAGARKGFDGVHSSTIWGFSRILEQMQENKPPLILLENVTGFLSANKGQDFLHTLLDLNDLGYVVDAFILDAIHFVPQSRPRLFVVGLLENAFPHSCKSLNLFGLESEIRPKNLATFIINHPQVKWSIRSLPPLPSYHCLLDTIVEDLPEKDSRWWSSERAAYLLSQMSSRHRQIVEKMIHDSRWSYGTVFRRMRNGKSTAELRTDGIAGCLRTPSGGSAKQILIKAGYGRYFVRLITPREAARLMGAGDYNITVPFDQALFGFGDAVCVSVIEWIARNYFEELIEEKLHEDTLQGKHQNCYGGNKLVSIEPEMQARLQEVYNTWYAGIDKDDGI